MKQDFARKRPPSRRGAIGFGLLVIAAIGGVHAPARAASSAGLDPVRPESEAPSGLLIESLRIAGSALRPRVSSDGTAVNLDGGCIYNSSGSATGVLNVPLQLPEGANVLTLRMYYFDTSASNSTAWFTVYDLYGSIVEEFSVASAGNAGNSFNDSAPIDHLIDPSLYSYVLNWRPTVAGATMQLCGFRVFYNPPVLFIDGFETGNTSQWSVTVP